MSLSIVIPSKDKATRLALCLKVLLKELAGIAQPWRIIVVDDGSTDGTDFLLSTFARACPDRFHVIRHARARGRAAARNAGAKASTGTLLLFLDDDVLVSPGLIVAHVAVHEKTERAIVARSKIVNIPWVRHLDDPLQPSMTDQPKLHARFKDVDRTDLYALFAPLGRMSWMESQIQGLLADEHLPRWPASTGGCLSLRRTFFTQLGGFDEAFGLHWGLEDLEFGYRAEQAGARIVATEDAGAYHLDHPMGERDQKQLEVLKLFGTRHGAAVEAKLQRYFSREIPLTEAVR